MEMRIKIPEPALQLEETIKFLLAENENRDSIFYHKIDLDNLEIGGCSQGGPAVFNMAGNQEHGYDGKNSVCSRRDIIISYRGYDCLVYVLSAKH